MCISCWSGGSAGSNIWLLHNLLPIKWSEWDQRKLTVVGVVSSCLVFGAWAYLFNVHSEAHKVKENAGFLGAAKQAPQNFGLAPKLVLCRGAWLGLTHKELYSREVLCKQGCSAPGACLSLFPFLAACLLRPAWQGAWACWVTGLCSVSSPIRQVQCKSRQSQMYHFLVSVWKVSLSHSASDRERWRGLSRAAQRAGSRAESGLQVCSWEGPAPRSAAWRQPLLLSSGLRAILPTQVWLMASGEVMCQPD